MTFIVETKSITINLKKSAIFVICILFVYLFCLDGIKHIRVVYNNKFSNQQCAVWNATLGYMKDEDHYYEKTFELEESKVNTLLLPSQSVNEYYIYGDLINNYKMDVFVNGKEIHSVSISTVVNKDFWERIYLANAYVFQLPELKKNEPNEIFLISGGKSRKYTIELK